MKSTLKAILTHFLVLTIFVGILQLSLTGCTDDLNLPGRNNEQNQFAVGGGVQPLLSQVIKNSNPDFSGVPIDFVYPIIFELNTGALFEAKAPLGVQELFNGQNGSLYVEGILLPFRALLDGQLVEVDSQQAFEDLLLNAGIEQAQNLFVRLHGQCFEAKYPFEVVLDFEENRTINSFDEILAITSGFGLLNIVIFNFPINFTEYESGEEIAVNNYFELSQLFGSCDECPTGGEPQPVKIDELSYAFHIPFELPNNAELHWEINGAAENIVPSDVNGEQGTVKVFEEGSHEICLRISTPDCRFGVTRCAFIEITP